MVSGRCIVIAALAAALLFAGCASEPRSDAAKDQRLVIPWMTLNGGRLAPPGDPHGIPQLKGAPPVFRPFVSPVSAALSASEVYVVDAGASTVFRFDLAMSLMAPVQGAPADRTSLLRVGPEQSLYMLDPGRRRAIRLSRSGQLLATYADVNLARPVDVAVEENGSQVLVADGVYGQIVAFHPLGRAAVVIHLRGNERERVLSLTHLAVGAEALYISDATCGCVARIARDGAVLDTFGHQLIAQAGAIAVDRYQRVFVADQLDRSVKVFWRGRLIETVNTAAMGVLQVSDLTVSGGTLAIADAAGARVHLMQIKPPPPAP